MKTFALLAASICTYHKLAEADLERVRVVEAAVARLDSTFTTLQGHDFANWQQAIDNCVAEVGAVLPRPTPEATIAARALSDVRMCGARAIGGKAPIGTSIDWTGDYERALRAFLLAAISAVVMDREIAPA